MIKTYGSGNSGRSMAKSIDWWLIAVYALLVIIGIVNIYASIHSAEAGGFWDIGSRSGKQLLWWGISLGFGSVILFALPARIYETLSLPAYLLLLLLLLAVIFLGQEVNGSNSWFAFGPVKFQPAELSKVTTSLMLAAYMSRVGYSMKNWKDFLITGLILVIPMILIVASKETGSALVYVGFVFMLYREGLSGWVIVMGGMAIILFVLTLVVSPYAAMLFLVSCTFLLIGLHAGKTKLTLLIEIPCVVFLSFLPMIFRSIEKAVYGIPEEIPEEIQEGIQEASYQAQMHLPVQPIHILCAATAIVSIIFLYKAFRRRSRFTYLALASTLAGIALVFSTEFIFNSVLQDHQRKRIEVRRLNPQRRGALPGARDKPSALLNREWSECSAAESTSRRLRAKHTRRRAERAIRRRSWSRARPQESTSTGRFGTSMSVKADEQKVAEVVEDGVRKRIRWSKWLIGRHSYPALIKTTIETWLQWFPQTVMHMSSPISGRLEEPSMKGDGTIVRIDLEFYALESKNIRNDLMSLEPGL